jgi:anti-sigma28 factor (negative regulator of flagellin synthesis)
MKPRERRKRGEPVSHARRNSIVSDPILEQDHDTKPERQGAKKPTESTGEEVGKSGEANRSGKGAKTPKESSTATGKPREIGGKMKGGESNPPCG